jgi:hypothetical protein
LLNLHAHTECRKLHIQFRRKIGASAEGSKLTKKTFIIKGKVFSGKSEAARFLELAWVRSHAFLRHAKPENPGREHNAEAAGRT